MVEHTCNLSTGQENQEFKVILRYLASLGTAWATDDTVSKEKNVKRKKGNKNGRKSWVKHGVLSFQRTDLDQSHYCTS